MVRRGHEGQLYFEGIKNKKPFVSFCVTVGSGQSGWMKKEKESEVDCIEDNMENM